MDRESKERLGGALTSYREMAEVAKMLGICLANVSGGDWTKQTKEWQEAAARWRDNYLKCAGKLRGQGG